MCLAIPGKVKKIVGKKVTVEYPGNETRQVLLGGEKVKVGDFILVQMGIVIKVITPKEARLTQKAWDNY